MSTKRTREPEENQDVHTEHCCLKHGCKYMGKDCTVESGEKVQSYRCEYCEDELQRLNASFDAKVTKGGSLKLTFDGLFHFKVLLPRVTRAQVDLMILKIQEATEDLQ